MVRGAHPARERRPCQESAVCDESDDDCGAAAGSSSASSSPVEEIKIIIIRNI